MPHSSRPLSVSQVNTVSNALETVLNAETGLFPATSLKRETPARVMGVHTRLLGQRGASTQFLAIQFKIFRVKRIADTQKRLATLMEPHEKWNIHRKSVTAFTQKDYLRRRERSKL